MKNVKAESMDEKAENQTEHNWLYFFLGEASLTFQILGEHIEVFSSTRNNLLKLSDYLLFFVSHIIYIS